MAFPRAAGYNNLPNGVFVPVIYSQKVLKFFRKVSVVEAITNTDYFGEIANYGDTVNIINEPVITVSAYKRGSTVIPQDLTDVQTTLTVDQANYFSFKVDDIEEKQAHTNWQSLATSSGAYALKDGFDKDVLSQIASGTGSALTYGSTGSPISMGFAAGRVTPLAIMNRLQRFLDENNVPTENRWFVADPQFWEQMMDENSRLMGANFTGDKESVIRNGLVLDGEIHGFKCYKSNNMPNDVNGNYRVVQAGHMSAVAAASQIAKTEVVRDQDSFADIVRGLHLYGRKVLRPSALALAYYAIN